jgi:hypothetical protein
VTRARPLFIAAVLGILTTIAIALALAAWMPLAMYPRQTIYNFVAGGRPWGAAERARFGVRNLWFNELNAESLLPPKPPISNLLHLFAEPKPDPNLPSSPEAWVALARKRTAGRTDLDLRDSAPWWGTFAFGGSAHPGVYTGTDHAFGWPCPALWYHVQGVTSRNTATATAIEGGLLLTPRSSLEVRGYDFRALPLWAFWPGLIADSAIFALLWWLALFAPGAFRRTLRRRRGQCSACGYDLRGNPPSAPCPECGRERIPIGPSLQT